MGSEPGPFSGETSVLKHWAVSPVIFLKNMDSLGCTVNVEMCLTNPTHEILHPKEKASLTKEAEEVKHIGKQ